MKLLKLGVFLSMLLMTPVLEAQMQVCTCGKRI